MLKVKENIVKNSKKQVDCELKTNEDEQKEKEKKKKDFRKQVNNLYPNCVVFKETKGPIEHISVLKIDKCIYETEKINQSIKAK